MKILLSAYACEPGAGSEYGVGWNVAVQLSKLHKVYVLTRSRCREKIENELRKSPNSNLHFLFYNLPSIMYYKNELQSGWGEQYNYILWQLFVLKFIKKQNKKYKFDIFHHLTFNQYRTPSPGFFINLPFVMGPIGGAETINYSFYADLNNHTKWKEKIRNKGRDLKVFGVWTRWKNNKKYFLFSTKENMERISRHCNGNSFKLIPAIAFDPKDFENLSITKESKNEFELVYAGKAYDWKGIHIFLKAVKNAFINNNISDFTVKLIGIRFEEEQLMVKNWMKELNLEKNCTLIPFIDRSELLNMLSTCNLSVYPAFRDSGSMSVLEASVLACPTICFDAGGQDAFPDDVLIKIPVFDTYNENLNCFSEKLLWAYNNKILSAEIGQRAQKYVFQNLTWEKKIEEINAIYNEILNYEKI